MRDNNKIAIEEMAHDLCGRCQDGICVVDGKPCNLDLDCTCQINAATLYNAGYRKQSEDVPDTNVGCKFCEDDYSLDNLVCYIPTDDGASIDPPVRYCPFCGAKMKGVE